MDEKMKSINLEDYKYELPEEKIALAPLPNRVDSKLLVFNKGNISHERFSNVTAHIPADAHLFFNNTRVIPARLHFLKDTGALIEIFLLEPHAPTKEVASAMLVSGKCVWKCMIGNQKKWKEGQQLSLKLTDGSTILTAYIIDREAQLVEFSWNSIEPFVQIIEMAGKIPLPPYINRDVNEEDLTRYQTVYSKFNGAVAAPTAGLHFDEQIISQLENKGVNIDYLTLHVSAGTFQPIKATNVVDHQMHSEEIIITKANIENLLESNFVVAVGTTSMRTLESLYWYGVKLLKGETEFKIHKLDPYQTKKEAIPTKQKALQAVLSFMEMHGFNSLTGQTEIFIFPGYEFKICNALITNFHLPGSTLILLVAAFIGERWREVYNEAIANDYRFLSYGDTSLLIP